jgi:replicative DNA helicase
MEILRLLLNYEFYEKNKNRVLKEFFPQSLYKVFELICNTHEKYKRNLSIDEVKTIYRVTYPTATVAHLNDIFSILDNLPEVGLDVAQEVLEKAWFTECGRQITQIGIDIVNGRETSFEKARALFDKIEEGKFFEGGDDLQPVSYEIDDIISELDVITKWPFGLAPLKTVCGGIGPSIFTVIAGRVEAGKSALAISLCAAPGGFADQGAKINYYVNEEKAIRSQSRAIMSYTGMPLLEIMINKNEAAEKYSKIKDNLRFFDFRDRDITDFSKHITDTNPDIVVIDQADKLLLKGVFAREDERLGALYSEIRNIAARTDSAIIGITQLNAEAEGKTYISSANLSNSRTAKAAEADIVLGIGKSPVHSEETRIINVIKSKITGRHDDVVCLLKSDISRYTA